MQSNSKDSSTATNASMTFKLPQNNQSQSMFVRLPAELRLIILRELLRFRKALRWSSRQKRIRISAGVHLMRTCQILHDEGEAILFGENVLHMYASHEFANYDSSDPHGDEDQIHLRIPVLNVDYLQSSLMGNYDHIHPDHQIDTDSALLRMTGKKGLTIQEGKDLIVTLQKFKRFELKVSRSIEPNYGDYTEDMFGEVFFHICRFLRNILQDKHFVVSFSTPQAKTLLERHPHLLQVCKVLQHTSIHVKDVAMSAKRKQLLESPRNVKDTYKQWYAFQKSIINMLPVIDREHYDSEDETFENAHYIDLKDLRDVALCYNARKYREKQEEILEMASEWKDRWWSHYTEKLKTGIERLREGVDQYKVVVGEDLTDEMELEFHENIVDQADCETESDEEADDDDDGDDDDGDDDDDDDEELEEQAKESEGEEEI